MYVTLCLTCVKTCDEVPYCPVDQTTLMLGDNKLEVDDYITCALPSRIARNILMSIKRWYAYCTTTTISAREEEQLPPPLNWPENEHYFFMFNDYCVEGSNGREDVETQLACSSASSASLLSSSSLLHSSSSPFCKQNAFNKVMLTDVFKEILQCKSLQNTDNTNHSDNTYYAKREKLQTSSSSLSCFSVQASPLVNKNVSSNIFDELVLCSDNIESAIGGCSSSSAGIRCEHLTDIEDIKQVSDALDDMERIDMVILNNRRCQRSITFHFCSQLSVMELGTMIGSCEPCHVYLFVNSSQSAQEIMELVEQWKDVKSLVESASCINKTNKNKRSTLLSQVEISKPITFSRESTTELQQIIQPSQSELAEQFAQHTDSNNNKNNDNNNYNKNEHSAETIKALEQEVIHLRSQIQSMQSKSTLHIDRECEHNAHAHNKHMRPNINDKCDAVDSSFSLEDSASAWQLIYANKEIARLTKEKEEMTKIIARQSHIIVKAKKALLSLSENQTNLVHSTSCTHINDKLCNTLSLESMRKFKQKERQSLH